MQVSRGFKGRGRVESALAERVPPGQHVTTDFPVLTAGPTPRTSLDDWSLAVHHGGSLIATWSWADFEALPQTDLVADIQIKTERFGPSGEPQ